MCGRACGIRRPVPRTAARTLACARASRRTHGHGEPTPRAPPIPFRVRLVTGGLRASGCEPQHAGNADTTASPPPLNALPPHRPPFRTCHQTMRILVVGASGATGRRVVKLLLERGHHVVAVVRQGARLPLERSHPRLTVEYADLLALSCNDPALPAQVRPLKRMPRRVSSCPAPDAAAGGCRTGSSRRSRALHAVGFRSGAGVRIAPSASG